MKSGIVKNMLELRRGGFYWIDKTPYLSVTTVLGIIDKPALRYWFGKEVYQAMLVDPTMDERTALAKPYETSDSAKERGSTVHSLVEAYKNTKKPIENIPSQYAKYASAFYDFMSTHDIKVIANEKSVKSDDYQIAGTLDMFATIGDKSFLIDVKTGKDIYQEAGLQLSAYAQMMKETGQALDEIAVLLLETGKDGLPTGKYKFQTMEEDFDAFLGAKALYEYINKEKLIKVGYYK